MNKIILIGGGSGAGKTTIAQLIKKAKNDVTIISLDNYCISHDELSLEERKKLNFDHPDSYDGKRASEDVKRLKNNESVAIPIYDFSIHAAKKEKQIINPHKYIIVDSIFSLYYPELLSLADYKIYISVDDKTRLKRRSERDLMYRGRSKEQTLWQWQTTVLPMHQKYIEPTKKNADYIFDNNEQKNINEIDVLEILQKI